MRALAVLALRNWFITSFAVIGVAIWASRSNVAGEVYWVVTMGFLACFGILIAFMAFGRLIELMIGRPIERVLGAKSDAILGAVTLSIALAVWSILTSDNAPDWIASIVLAVFSETPKPMDPGILVVLFVFIWAGALFELAEEKQ